MDTWWGFIFRTVAVILCVVNLSDAFGQRELINPDSELSQEHALSKRQWGRTGNVAWGKRWGGNVAWGKRWGTNNVAWGKRNDYDLDDDDKSNLVDKRDWKHIRLRAWGKRSVDEVKSRIQKESQALNKDKKAWGRQVSWGKRGANKFPLYKGTIAEEENDDVENDLKRAWHGSAVAWGKRQEQKNDKRAWTGNNVSWGKRNEDKRAWTGNNISWGKRWGTGNVAWGKRNPETEEEKRAWRGGNVAWGKKRAWNGNVSWGKRAEEDDKRAWVGKSISWGKKDTGEEKEEDKKRAWGGNVAWGKRQEDQQHKGKSESLNGIKSLFYYVK